MRQNSSVTKSSDHDSAGVERVRAGASDADDPPGGWTDDALGGSAATQPKGSASPGPERGTTPPPAGAMPPGRRQSDAVRHGAAVDAGAAQPESMRSGEAHSGALQPGGMQAGDVQVDDKPPGKVPPRDLPPGEIQAVVAGADVRSAGADMPSRPADDSAATEISLPSVSFRDVAVAEHFADAAGMPIGLVDLGAPEGPTVVASECIDGDAIAAAWRTPSRAGPQSFGMGDRPGKHSAGLAVAAPIHLSGRKGWVVAIEPDRSLAEPRHHALARLLQDITADHQNQTAATQHWVQRLQTEVSLYERVHELAGMGTLTCDLRAGRLQVSTRALDILNCNSINTLSDFICVFVPHDRLALRRLLTGQEDGETGVIDCEIQLPRQESQSIRLSVAFFRAGNTITGWIGTVEDNTEELRRIAQLTERAERDAVTSVYNRDQLEPQLQKTLTTARLERASVGLLLVAIDGFRRTTQIFGHAAGDIIMRFAARSLSRMVRASDIIVRMSAEEFAIIMVSVTDDAGVQRRAEDIRANLATSVNVGTDSVDISASIGYAIYPQDTEQGLDLYAAASYALSETAPNAPSAICRYHPAVRKQREDEKRGIGEFRRAIDANEFTPYFQPKVDLESGRVTGFEALCRWCHPERGVLPPGAFLAGLNSPIVGADLSNVSLIGSFRAAHEFHRLGLSFGQISINLSSLQLARPGLIDMVSALRTQYEIDPSEIAFEVLENVLIREKNVVHHNLHALSGAGYAISLDDFGTGFASLTHLREPFIREVKIDRSFVMRSSSNPHDLQIVNAIIQMARKLGLKTVAEGIEDEETLRKLRAMGCTVGQGFVFAPALPFEEAVEFLGRQARIFSMLSDNAA